MILKKTFKIMAIVLGIIGILVAGLCVYSFRIPEAIIILGCSILMMALPSVVYSMNGSHMTVAEKQVVKKENATKLNKNDTVLLTVKGRCRVMNDASEDCIMSIMESYVDFRGLKNEKILKITRNHITDVKTPNAHTLVIIANKSDECKFICNDVSLIQSAIQILNA